MVGWFPILKDVRSVVVLVWSTLTLGLCCYPSISLLVDLLRRSAPSIVRLNLNATRSTRSSGTSYFRRNLYCTRAFGSFFRNLCVLIYIAQRRMRPRMFWLHGGSININPAGIRLHENQEGREHDRHDSILAFPCQPVGHRRRLCLITTDLASNRAKRRSENLYVPSHNLNKFTRFNSTQRFVRDRNPRDGLQWT